MQINILGQIYSIRKNVAPAKDKGLLDCGGYCNPQIKQIVIADVAKLMEGQEPSETDLSVLEKQYLRHEIIHAFFFESGLGHNTLIEGAWATHEELVDWFAIQSPKIYKAFEKAGCI